MRARARAHVHAPAPEESMQREREPNVGQTHTPFIRGAPGAFTVTRAGKSRRSATLFFSPFHDTELQLALQFKYLNVK